MTSRIVTAATWVVVAVILAFALALAAPRLGGGDSLTILTGSMQPTIRPGDVVAVVPVDTDDLRVGDVVTFQPVSGDPTLITHRLVEIDDSASERRFVTRGDANSADDPAIIGAQVQGRVLYVIPVIGWISSALGPAVPGIVAVCAAGLIVFGAVALLRPGTRPTSRKAAS